MAKKSIKITEEEFPGNSKLPRKVAPIRDEEIFEPDEVREDVVEEKPKKARRVVRGEVIRKKKTLVQSIAESIVGDGSRDVVTYILSEVLIPAAKSTIQDMVTSGIEMFLYGESNGPRRDRRDKDRSIVSYGKFYKSRDRDDDRRDRRKFATHRGDKFNLDEIYFKDHADAEGVLEELCDRLEEYDEVTVADYFELAGIEGATWVHHKYGWSDLKRAYNTHTRHGWAIVLPDPEELE